MGLFNRKKRGDASVAGDGTATEHAVFLHFTMSGDGFGSEHERQLIFELEERLERAVDKAGAGELDGNEFGGGEAVLYLYGPDKDRLWAAVEVESRQCPLRPAFALLRAGGPGTTPEQVQL